ncbi:hypothetical protein ACOSP7_008777 [Xanthoceras sorbifolium]
MKIYVLWAWTQIYDLAAKVLKKPNLCKCGLAELHREVGVTIAAAGASPSSCPPPSAVSKVKVETAAKVKFGTSAKVKVEIACPDWRAVAFSDEEIKTRGLRAYCIQLTSVAAEKGLDVSPCYG